MAKLDIGGGPRTPKKPIPKPKPVRVRPGGRGDEVTALDYMTPAQRALLSEGARRVASMIGTSTTLPEAASPNFVGAYLPAGADNRSPGTIYVKPRSRGNAGDDIIMHETLHGFDYMNRQQPSKNLYANLTPEQKNLLYRMYFRTGGPVAKPFSVIGGLISGDQHERERSMAFLAGIKPSEAYATAGQNNNFNQVVGLENLKEYYKSFYK